MAKILTLNVAALTVLAANVQVRVREKDGVMQIRPSARVISTNLPKGETMRKLGFKKDGDKVRAATVTVTDIAALEAGTAYKLVDAKYGWFALVAGEPAKGDAFGRVSVK